MVDTETFVHSGNVFNFVHNCTVTSSPPIFQMMTKEKLSPYVPGNTP